MATAATGMHHQNNNYQHYQAHSNYVNEMDAFPKTLMERLMRPENDMKVSTSASFGFYELAYT